MGRGAEMTDLRLKLEKQYGAEKRRALKEMEERVRYVFKRLKNNYAFYREEH